jgi:hypothetical protein
MISKEQIPGWKANISSSSHDIPGIYPFTDETQTASFKAPVRTAL